MTGVLSWWGRVGVAIAATAGLAFVGSVRAAGTVRSPPAVAPIQVFPLAAPSPVPCADGRVHRA